MSCEGFRGHERIWRVIFRRGRQGHFRGYAEYTFMSIFIPEQKPTFLYHFEFNSVMRSTRDHPMSESSLPSSPSVKDATPTFDVEKADIILRSADNVDFRTFKSLLSFASPFFEAMFTLPSSADASSSTDQVKDGLPVVQMAESSDAIEKLLLFCHPSCAPVLEDLQYIPPVLNAAIKYDMQGVVKRIRKNLIATQFIDKEPLRVFAIASRFHLDDEAVLAARHTLNFPFFPRKYVPELEHITAGTLHRLQSYHFHCGKAAKAVATSVAWIQLDSCLHFGVECWECSFGETITISVGSTISARRWWLDYMRDTIDPLVERPCGATVIRPDLMNKALKKASECRICREKAFLELNEFAELFALEIEAAVSTITLRTG